MSHRSRTTKGLPNINKTFIARKQSEKKNMQYIANPEKSLTFLQKIEDVTSGIQYHQKPNKFIKQQHTKLKNVLRNMNSDTLKLINQQIVKSSKLKKKKVTPANTVLIAEKQVNTNEHILSICKYEIAKLQERSKYLCDQNHGIEDYMNKIKQIQLKIHEAQLLNNTIHHENNVDGINTVRSMKSTNNILPKMQEQNYLWKIKIAKLQMKQKNVNDQIIKIKQNYQELRSKENSIESQYIIALNNLKQLNISNKNEIKLQDKKKILQPLQQKVVFQQKYLQYKYLKLLKDLEKQESNLQLTKKKIQIIEGKTKNTNYFIQQLEEELKDILIEKKIKQIKVQEFIQNNSKLNVYDQQQKNNLHNIIQDKFEKTEVQQKNNQIKKQEENPKIDENQKYNQFQQEQIKYEQAKRNKDDKQIDHQRIKSKVINKANDQLHLNQQVIAQRHAVNTQL